MKVVDPEDREILRTRSPGIITCPKCGYEWESRVPKPKNCPRQDCQALLEPAAASTGRSGSWNNTPVRIDRDVYAAIMDAKRRLEAETGRPQSLNAALRWRLGLKAKGE